MKLPPCHSRREPPPGEKRFICAHPKVHAPGGLVTAEICRLCRQWQAPPPETFRPFPPPLAETRRALLTAPPREPCFHLGEQSGWRECATCRGAVKLKVFACRHPLHQETTVQECRACQDYDERLRRGSVRSWAVGVTTAPRREPALQRTLQSLADAGWSDARLFAEPGAPIPSAFAHLAITQRDAPLGAWSNFFLALSELVLREPHADAYFLLQDDVVFCQNLRRYLEQSLWPSETAAVVSAYCSSDYAHRASGWRAVDAGWTLIGAVTCIFPSAAARSFLSFARAVNFRQRGPNGGMKNVDSMLGVWARANQLPVYFHTPSLALHIGETSVVWPGLSARAHRQAKDFVGEGFDAMSFLPRHADKGGAMFQQSANA